MCTVHVRTSIRTSVTAPAHTTTISDYQLKLDDKEYNYD